MPRSCYQMQHALPERIGAKQKRLPREAVFVSTTTGETTVNHRDNLNSGLRHGQAAQASDSAQAQAHYGNAQAQPISQVEMAVGHIDGGMRELAGIIQRLTQRLSPVLTPACDRAEGEGNRPSPAAPAPLVGQIEVLSDQLRLHCAALQDMEQRLAL